MFWFLTICLLLLASAFVLVPLINYGRKKPAEKQGLSRKEGAGKQGAGKEEADKQQTRKEINIAIFEQRQSELQLELDNGNLDSEQFEELKFELQRSLLADVSDDPAEERAISKQKKAGEARGFFRGSRLVPLCLVLLMPVTAYSLYNQWGSINEIELSELYAETMNVADDPQQIRDLILSLGEVVKSDPENGWAWYFLARNLTTVGLYELASNAFHSASDLVENPGDKAVILGQYAQAEYLASERNITPAVREIIAKAQAINPNEMSVLQLLSSEAIANEEYAQAISYWRRMLQQNPRSENAQFIRQSIAMAESYIDESEPGASAPGPEIEVHLSLQEGLTLPAETRVFVSAKAATGPPMPLAAKDLYVRDLPATIVLNNAAAVGPINLSAFDTVNVSATASSTGTSNIQSGDYRVTSENFAHAGQHTVIDLIIKENDLIP